MICQCWVSGASAKCLRIWIKVRWRLLVSAALLTKPESIDFLFVLSLNYTNRRFSTLPPRHFSYSHDSHHRSKSNSVNLQFSPAEMWLTARCKDVTFSLMCKHLGEGVSGEAGLSSVDSLDPPIFSGPLLAEQCPDGEKHDNSPILVFSVQSQKMHIGTALYK